MKPLIASLRYWHLCSLDAPSVALLWTIFVARSFQTSLSYSLEAAFFIAVWMLYACDRLLDARSPSREDVLMARHAFHKRHRRIFLAMLAFASLLLLVLLSWIPLDSLASYFILLLFLFVYLYFTHLQKKTFCKEIVVGILFSAGVFAPAWNTSLAWVLYAMLFAAICTCNCLLITRWESDEASFPRWLFALMIAFFALLIGLKLVVWPLLGALSTALIALSVVHFTRGHMRPTTLRACADAALLTPLLFMRFG